MRTTHRKEKTTVPPRSLIRTFRAMHKTSRSSQPRTPRTLESQGRQRFGVMGLTTLGLHDSRFEGLTSANRPVLEPAFGASGRQADAF